MVVHARKGVGVCSGHLVHPFFSLFIECIVAGAEQADHPLERSGILDMP